MPKISVIVPVYKAEKYIRRCVDSILAQTFTDFELLLIDDGSPDNSGAICDEYAAKDSRVKVFHKENGGVSCARQMGLDNSLGEYVIHADPDDWVEPDMLQELYSEAKQRGADMVICDFYINYDNRQIYKSQKPEKLSHDAILKDLLMQRLHGSCWNKLVKRELFDKYDVKFPEEFNLCEDFYLNCCLLSNKIKISYLQKAFYHYIRLENENSYTLNSKHIEDRLKAINSVEIMLKSNTEFYQAIYSFKLYVCFLMLKANYYLDRQSIYKTIDNVEFIINNEMPFLSNTNKRILKLDYNRQYFLVITSISLIESYYALRRILKKILVAFHFIKR